MDALIERLKQIGLNTYEAKVYLALLKQHPGTGYEVSKESGVPQARAYDTLKTLETKKIVVSTGTKPVTYVPVPPDELLTRFEDEYHGAIEQLRNALPNYSVETIEPVHNLRGQDAIYDNARRMIDSAQDSIFIEHWSDDQDFLEEPLRQAAERGVSVRVVGYNNVNYDFGDVYIHPLATSIKDTIGEQRWIIMSVDSTEGLVMSVNSHEVLGQQDTPESREPKAICTKNPTMVFIIKEFIVHDIFLLDVEQTIPDAIREAYGDQELPLRNKILSKRELLIGAH